MAIKKSAFEGAWQCVEDRILYSEDKPSKPDEDCYAWFVDRLASAGIDPKIILTATKVACDQAQKTDEVMSRLAILRTAPYRDFIKRVVTLGCNAHNASTPLGEMAINLQHTVFLLEDDLREFEDKSNAVSA